MEAYDPTWLVELAKKQRPELVWFHEALVKCTQVVEKQPAYIRFINADNPNAPGSEWQYSYSVELNCPENGFLVVDVMKDRRVGGVEFVDKIPFD